MLFQRLQRVIGQHVVADSGEQTCLAVQLSREKRHVRSLAARDHQELTPKEGFSRPWPSVGSDLKIDVDTANGQNSGVAHERS